MNQKRVDNGIQVIARAASILYTLENQQTGITLAQIARMTDLPRSTVNRIVSALEAEKFVVSDKSGYRLGPTLTRLAKSSHKDIVLIARPSIEVLARKTRETIDLCVFRGHHSVSVDQYPADRELRVISPIGTSFAIHCTAHGKAILSQLSEEKLMSVLDEKLEKRTPYTICERSKLIEQLKQIKKDGIAFDNEEHALGVKGIGVYINTGDDNQHYAIALAVPTVRFDENFKEYCELIKKCKAEIEAIVSSN